MSTVLANRKVVDGLFLPASVSDSIHYYMLHGISENEVYPILERERIYFFLRYMLSRHFGEVLCIRFTPKVVRFNIILYIKEIITRRKRYVVDGKAVINPFNSSMYFDVKIIREEATNINPIKMLDEGTLHRINSEEAEIRFYI